MHEDSDFPPFRPSRRALLAAAGAAMLPHSVASQTPAMAQPRTLVLEPVRRTVKPDGGEATLFAADGTAPGPVIRVKKGQSLDLTVENRLPQPTALHIHGLRGPNAAQGIPGLGTEPLKPGETRVFRIEPPDSGTFFYGPTLIGHASEQLERGLAGFFVVEEADPPAADHDLPLALDDMRLEPNGDIAPNFGDPLDSARAGRLGNTLIINGKTEAHSLTVRPNARIRLRLANLANARIMPMRFEGLKASVIALDGQGCDPFDPLRRTVILVPGSRYDVMLDAPAEAGQEGRILIAIGNGFKVLSVMTEGAPLPARPPVTALQPNTLPGEIRLAGAHRAEFSISGGWPYPDRSAPPPKPEDLAKRFPDRTKIWSLNSGFNSGFSGRPVFTVKRGAVVVLALANRSDWPQVVTLHGHVFRLLHPLDDGWEPYFLDTLYLPPQSIQRVAFDAANPGRWAIRSTIPEHYESGVASWYEVTA